MQNTQKYLRISPRKLRLIADAIRKLSPAQAIAYLKFTPKSAALPMSKAIRTAISNAKDQQGLSAERLMFKTIDVMGGPTYKRFRAVSRGMAHSIAKRTSHIKIVLQERSHGAKS